jgi:hypothetical protein
MYNVDYLILPITTASDHSDITLSSFVALAKLRSFNERNVIKSLALLEVVLNSSVDINEAILKSRKSSKPDSHCHPVLLHNAEAVLCVILL